MKRLTLLLVVMGGCGGSPEESPPPSSGFVDATAGGTRLEARFVEAGATRDFLGWRDTRLDLPCAFQDLGGELRCLPDGPEAASVNGWYFADAACTVPVADLAPDFRWFAACPQPRYAISWGTGANCADKPRFYRVAGRHMSTAYRQDGGRCVAAPPNAFLTSLGQFTLEPIALEELVAGTLKEGPAAGGIRPVYVATTDGARALWTLRDAAGGFGCALRNTTEGLRCLPIDAALIGYRFADPGCTAPAAMALSCRESLRPSIPFGFTGGYEDGKAVSKVHEGGPRLMKSFVGSGASCVADTSGFAGFSVGAEIPSSRFVAGTTELAPGDGLAQPVDAAGGWSIRGVRRLQDPRGNFECSYAPASDGKLRCLPYPTTPAPTLYADAACTTIVSPGGELAVSDKATCPARVRVFARGEEHKTAVYQKENGACVFASDPPPSFPKITYYRFPTELAPTQFVEMRAVTE